MLIVLHSFCYILNTTHEAYSDRDNLSISCGCHVIISTAKPRKSCRYILRISLNIPSCCFDRQRDVQAKAKSMQIRIYNLCKIIWYFCKKTLDIGKVMCIMPLYVQGRAAGFFVCMPCEVFCRKFTVMPWVFETGWNPSLTKAVGVHLQSCHAPTKESTAYIMECEWTECIIMEYSKGEYLRYGQWIIKRIDRQFLRTSNSVARWLAVVVYPLA